MGLLVALAALAGCAGLEGAADAGGSLVRIVQLDLGADLLGAQPNDAADVLGALGSTRFEYTHNGGALDPAKATVRFVDGDGREREEPLTSFTTLESVGRGDKVTVDDVLLTSPVSVQQGEKVLAARGAPVGSWLEVAGYPLPLAAQPGGRAVWSFDSTFAFDASADRFATSSTSSDYDYVCSDAGSCSFQEFDTHEDVRVDGMVANVDVDGDGRMSLEATSSGTGGTVLALGLDGKVSVDALFDAHVVEVVTGGPDGTERTDANFGLQLGLDAQGDGKVRLTFRGNSLVAMGAEGDLSGSGDLSLWDDENPRSAPMKPGFLDDLDFSFPYEEMPVDLESNPIAFLAEAMADAWRMDLAPGDEFRIASEAGPSLPSLVHTIRVVDAGTTTVPAGTFETYRVESTAQLRVPLSNGGVQSFDLPTSTSHVDRATGLPVSTTYTASLHMDQDDLAALFAYIEEAAAEEDATVQLPTQVMLALEASSTAELVEHQPGLRLAPTATILSPAIGFVVGMMASEMGGESYEEDDW